jgi:2,3-bisphosphoglycerate-independent phosphoglycerate mutase
MVTLVILDGWGIAPPGPGNAITLAQPKNFAQLWEDYPHTQLRAAGKAVGLPEGADGNSEVGHLSLGAGRIFLQDVARINQTIETGSFFDNQALLAAFAHARNHQSQVHMVGMIGSGIVHSANNHLFALLHLARRLNFSQVNLHLFTDGRDSLPKSALISLAQLEQVMHETGVGTIATIIGRYFSMDRDQRWERTQKAYELLTEGKGFTAKSASAAVSAAYQRGETDEFIKPTLITVPDKPPHLVKSNDALIFFNFRVDRMRQLAKAFILPDFEKKAHQTGFDLKEDKLLAEQVAKGQRHSVFTRPLVLTNLHVTTMTEYETSLPVAGVAFPERTLSDTLGEVVSQASLPQLRASETEKERFVTYYFNGFRQEPFALEERLIVPSPPVATYDLQPEMSAYLLTEKFLKRLEEKPFPFAVLNFANPDMVGHTGKIDAAVQAIQVVDECLAGIADFVLARRGTLLITADHGNAEEMIERSSGKVDTKHSVSSVPFLIVKSDWQEQAISLPEGILADVAPTALSLLGLTKPEVMTGTSLVSQLIQHKEG